jgi:hypothetical protein
MATRKVQQEIKPSLVTPVVAGVASLLIPGLGQALARQLQRGLILLGALATSIGLFAWRVSLLASREVGWVARFSKAFSRRPFFVGPFLIGIAILWLGIAWDAYQRAQPDRKASSSIFVVVLVLLFALGWQVGEIDLYKMIVELPDARGPISRIGWPWAAAITRDTETVGAGADILSPCDDEPPPPPPEEIAGQPYLAADPTCGDLSRQAEEGGKLVTIPGTALTVIGRGFEPNTETQIWWADPIGNEFQMRREGEYLTILTDDQGAFQLEVTIPYRLIPPSSEGRQVHLVEARQISTVGGLETSDELHQ